MLRQIMFIYCSLLLLVPVLSFDPAQIFAEGINYEPVYADVGISFDNTKRIIWHTTRYSHKEYPYPKEIREVSFALIEDESIGLITLRVHTIEQNDQLYLLNTDTGIFQPYPNKCSALPPITIGYRSFQIPYIQNIDQWTYHREDHHTVLCHIESGETRKLPELPENAVWGLVLPSPDREYLLLVAHAENDGSYLIGDYPYSLDMYYSYNVVTQEAFLLGSQRPRELYHLDQWLTNTEVIFANGQPGNSYITSYYSVDLTIPESFHEVVDDAQFRDGRYEGAITNATYSRRWDGKFNCRLWFYSAGMNEGYYSTLANDCGGIVRLADGNYLYLAFDKPIIQTSTLYHLDVTTDQRTSLLSGEFETFLSASPTGRYVALLQDDSGKVDRADIHDFQFFDPSTLNNPHLVIFDLQTGETKYQTPASYDYLTFWEWDKSRDVIASGLPSELVYAAGMGASVIPVWLDDETAILMRVYGDGFPKTDWLLNLLNGQKTGIDNVIGISDDGQRLLVADMDGYFVHQIKLYDRSSQSTFLITNHIHMGLYSEVKFNGFQSDGSFDLCFIEPVTTETECYNLRLDS